MKAIHESNSLLGFLFHDPGRLGRGIFLAILRSFMIAPIPWLFGMMIDNQVPSGNTTGILVTSILIIGLLFLHMGFAVSGAKVIGGEITAMVKEMRGEIFRRLQFLSFGYLDSSTTGRLVSKYAFDTTRVQDIGLQVLNQVVPTLFYGFSVLAIMLVLNWQLSVVVVLIIPVFMLAKQLFRKRLEDRNHAARLAQEKLTGSATEMISALRLVRSLGEEEKAENRLSADNSQVAETRVGLITVVSIFGTFLFVSNQLIALIVIATGAFMVVHGMLTVGTLFAFVAALPIIMQPFQMISQFIEQYVIGQESYRSIRELTTCTYVEEWKGTERLEAMKGGIGFHDVTFAYPGKEAEPVLENFNLIIRPGENLALVGQSGSGKSTLANLVLGLYSIQKGFIEIDGVPQSRLDMRSFRKRCAIVMQDNLLLSGSILENIRFARDDASDAEVMEAARAANADDFIRQLPDGYSTVVGERGVSLSGGQRQRISIARAILRDPQILILDEATSALDNESEALIQEALERLTEGRTVITIAHRLSTIRNADRIVVLKEGRILEQGSFAELVEKGGAFAGLLQSQIRISEQLAPSA